MTVENGLEALKARSEFAKNIYAVADARISAYDSQAGVLVAAAIAVAGFGVASWGRGGLHVGWFIAAALAAVASVLASVNARAVVPKPVSNALKQRLNDSEKAVADALALQPRDADSTTTSHKVIFNAWHVMSLFESSAGHQEQVLQFGSASALTRAGILDRGTGRPLERWLLLVSPKSSTRSTIRTLTTLRAAASKTCMHSPAEGFETPGQNVNRGGNSPAPIAQQGVKN